MSYQVLARKWRPRTFREMVGQEHVLQALINALDHDRLHHAYLFTGTRGVGKTTIGRILAKCLNCETGVSSEPCNQCSACQEINEGRFVDLIEVDAASRTKVEDTRELLENVQYAPSRGRYKVYLIDEVHMLSNSSFNALLKTLEEPPPHVKFLLATTDPQKLPVTILSRCLQFNLKNMNPERIVNHLMYVLEKELVPFEEAALWQLARSADGSMRDALSLTDQSIAFGDGKVTDADVRIMLGTIDQLLVYKVIDGLMTESAPAILKAVNELAEHAPDYSAALAELITTFHRIAIAQALPEAIDNSQGDRQKIYDFAQSIATEDIQLYYQTALLGRRDLPLAPDPRSGFEMVLLRMLAFKPQGVVHLPKTSLSGSVTHTEPEIATPPNPSADQQPMVESALQPTHPEESSQPEKQAQRIEQELPLAESEDQLLAQALPHHDEALDSSKKSSAVTTAAIESIKTEINHVTSTAHNDALTHQELTPDTSMPSRVDRAVEKANVVEEIGTTQTAIDDIAADVVNVPLDINKVSLDAFTADDWFAIYKVINPGGLLQSTVANSHLLQRNENRLSFIVDEQQSTLYDDTHQQRLAELLTDYFEQPVVVSMRVGEVQRQTPAQIIIARQQQRQQEAEIAIAEDPVIEQLQTVFNAKIIKDSIVAIGE